MTYTYEYPRPAVTVDALIIAKEDDRCRVLLIQRGKDPFKEMWALPGGFVDMDEDLDDAISREVMEETGLKLNNFNQLSAFGKPNRDPRHRTITIAFYTYLENMLPVKGMDDAINAQWFLIDKLPLLAFDHQEVIDFARKRLGL
jgi:8-oxo-dGTP diphosphatase